MPDGLQQGIRLGTVKEYVEDPVVNVQDQSAEFRRRRYSKTSVRGEIRPKIGIFRYSSDICVVLPDLRNIRQIFVACLTSRNIRQIFDSSSTTNEREACPQS